MVGPVQVLVVKTKPRTSKAGFLQDELGCAGEVTNWPCYWGGGFFLEGWVRTKGTRDAQPAALAFACCCYSDFLSDLRLPCLLVSGFIELVAWC